MNSLRHKAEFRRLLKDYQPSSETLELLKQTPLVLLLGLSGSGRNTIINELIKTGRYHYIISNTTRSPRINNGVKEKNGGVYWFVDEERFLEELKNGKMLEAELIHDLQVYGTSVAELSAAKSSNKIAINEVDVGGFFNIIQMKPDTVGILVLPPSLDILLDRLGRRGQMTLAETAKRLRTGIRILQEVLNASFVQIVINDDLSEAVREIDLIVAGKHNSLNRPANLAIAKQLLLDIEKYLG